ncbi:hypothetical protein MferCBS31731_005972 [Microsporum ferrugineum]
MTSNTTIPGLGSKSHPADVDGQPIVLHVVSPSFDAQRRITFNDLPLSTTISEVKAKITQELPSRPPPESQRLIYRGKPLSDNNQVLKHIVEPSDTLVYSMHLVLPPSTSSIPTFKPRGVSSASGVLSDNDTRPNTLRYRNSQGSIEIAPRNRTAGQFTPLQDHAISRLNEEERTQSQSQERSPINTTTLSHHSHQFNPTTGIWGRIGQNTLQDSRVSPTTFTSPQNLGSVPPVRNPLAPNQPLNQPLRPLSDQPLQHLRSHNGLSEAALPVQRTASHPPTQPAQIHRTSTSTLDSESRRYQLGLVVRNIITMESQLQAGIIPRVDEISAARSQLYQHLDQQHRSLLEPRDVPIEGWIMRVSTLATRADQLRLLRARNLNSTPSQRTSPTTMMTSNISRHTPYLVVSPSGYQGVLLPPTDSLPASISRATTTHFLPPAIPFAPNGITRHINVNRPLNPDLLRVRRRHSVVIRGATLVKVIRALWLFIRLYFFCYILSDSGTWFRVFLVTLSIAWACLSETDIPQQVRRAIFNPLRRHVEGLLPVQPGLTQPPRRRQDHENDLQGRRASRAFPRDHNEEEPQGRNAQTGILQRNRGLERGIALFFASLIPGISEQQIAAMNAANAVRENEERARQEQEDQAAQQEPEAAANEELNPQAGQTEGHHNGEGQPPEL